MIQILLLHGVEHFMIDITMTVKEVAATLLLPKFHIVYHVDAKGPVDEAFVEFLLISNGDKMLL